MKSDGRRQLDDSTRHPAAAAVACLALALALASGASAAVFQVNTTADVYYLLCIDQTCSLREAVAAANASSGADVIYLPSGRFTLSRIGSYEDAGLTGDLDVTSDLVICGAGPDATVIDAAGLGDRVLHLIEAGVSVTLNDLTLTGGDIDGSEGGGVLVDGASLTVSNCRITGNRTTIGGGGIRAFSGSTVVIQSGSVISANTANSDGGGVNVALGDLEVTDSTIADNHARGGGGVFAYLSDVAIAASTISGNTATAADGRGGGLLLTTGAANPSQLVNSTLHGNHANGDGGALFLANAVEVLLHSVTVHANSTAGLGSDIAVDSTSHLAVVSSLLSADCAIAGDLTSHGGNLESPGNTCRLTALDDYHGAADPMLMELGDYGGATRTLLPMEASPAMGRGSDTYAMPADQRGVARLPGTEVGAVERRASDPSFASGFEVGSWSGWSAATH